MTKLLTALRRTLGDAPYTEPDAALPRQLLRALP